ncbi:DUF2841 domain-containing protein [Aspergillus undulatus]|uniref:DUF2841 domain-containing protein n=1 Tax=Aspergillus undulatus TaxID=1810928 RepID=UPI003CCCFAD8
MDAPLDCLSTYHFALLYIDESGKLRFEASSSIANDCHTILSPEAMSSFLKAVAYSEDGTKPAGSLGGNFGVQGRRSPFSPESPVISCYSRRSSISQTVDENKKRKRKSHEYVLPMSLTCYSKSMLPIGNRNLLRKYYEEAFVCLQQTNCRILAKAYVKLVEPRKQVSYPYNGHKTIAGVPHQYDPEETKPPWWPVGVTHREPDHLRKPDRIRLLVHILCELRESHAITVEKLKEADQSIRRQIMPVERLQVLDEIYRVRKEEERYLDGGSSGMLHSPATNAVTDSAADSHAVVYVSRVHLPDVADSQTSFYSPTASFSHSDSSYRHDVPGLESHTSVFPSNFSSSDTSISRREADTTPNPIQPISAAPTVVPAVPTTWDTCHLPVPVSSSLPPINSAIGHPSIGSSTTSYPFSYHTSIYPHHEPTPAYDVQAQAFTMESYQQPHQQHPPPHISHQESGYQTNLPPQTSMSPMGSGAQGSGTGYPHPYYFGY